MNCELVTHIASVDTHSSTRLVSVVEGAMTKSHGMMMDAFAIVVSSRRVKFTKSGNVSLQFWMEVVLVRAVRPWEMAWLMKAEVRSPKARNRSGREAPCSIAPSIPSSIRITSKQVA